MRQPDFDKDYKFGTPFEDYVADTLRSYKGEMKAEREGEHTGNHFCEFECSGHPSGIAVTKSDFWHVVLPTSRIFVTIPMDVMKNIARYCYYTCPVTTGGDNDAARGILIPLEWLFNPFQKFDVDSLKRTGCPF